MKGGAGEPEAVGQEKGRHSSTAGEHDAGGVGGRDGIGVRTLFSSRKSRLKWDGMAEGEPGRE